MARPDPVKRYEADWLRENEERSPFLEGRREEQIKLERRLSDRSDELPSRFSAEKSRWG